VDTGRCLSSGRAQRGPVGWYDEVPMFYVYMLASKPYGTLYVGVTSELIRRVFKHKSKAVPGFTARY